MFAFCAPPPAEQARGICAGAPNSSPQTQTSTHLLTMDDDDAPQRRLSWEAVLLLSPPPHIKILSRHTAVPPPLWTPCAQASPPPPPSVWGCRPAIPWPPQEPLGLAPFAAWELPDRSGEYSCLGTQPSAGDGGAPSGAYPAAAKDPFHADWPHW
jgi:hypothetical protein